MRISDWSSDVCSSDLGKPGKVRGIVLCQSALGGARDLRPIDRPARHCGPQDRAVGPGHHRPDQRKNIGGGEIDVGIDEEQMRAITLDEQVGKPAAPAVDLRLLKDETESARTSSV